MVDGSEKKERHEKKTSALDRQCMFAFCVCTGPFRYYYRSNGRGKKKRKSF
jgi:hypothetical protein